MIFNILPVEIVEQILSYLNRNDIVAIFIALNKQYCILSDYFWKTICVKEDFVKQHPKQDWHECFRIGMNKRIGNYTLISNGPSEILKHIYAKSLITHCRQGDLNLINVHVLDCENKFNAVQQIQYDSIEFKEDLILIHRQKSILMYNYNHNTNIYELYTSFPELKLNIIGFDKKHFLMYDQIKKCFNLHELDNSYANKNIELPTDVKFLIMTQNCLHSEEIVISVLSFEEAYKIKVYNLMRNAWTLDLVCFASTGITNEPNIWVGSHFIGCCDVSYRSRGIYFGMFKVWDKQGQLLFQQDVGPSTKHYLRCFFKDGFIILTTSDNTVNIGNSTGHWISEFHTSTSFIDIKMSSGNLLFILLEDNKTVQIYDWTVLTCLYNIQLHSECNSTVSSEWLYCPYNTQYNTLEVVHFLNNTIDCNYFVTNKEINKCVNFIFLFVCRG